MTILLYILIGVTATFIGKIEKRVNIAAMSAPLALPLGIMSAIGATLWLLVILKGFVLVAALVLFLLTKLKFVIGAKLAALFASMAAAALGIATGPFGWIVMLILLYFFFGVLKDAIIKAFFSTYEWFFAKLIALLFWVRRKADAARACLPRPLHFLVWLVEVPIVCGASASAIWDVMDWADGKIVLTTELALARVVCMSPFVVLTYRAYLRDTTPPNNGGDGLDLPAPLPLLPG